MVCNCLQNPSAEPAAPVGGSSLRAAAGVAVGARVAGHDRAPGALARAALHRAVQHAGVPAPAAARRGARHVLPPAGAQALAAGPVFRRATAVPLGRVPSPQAGLGARGAHGLRQAPGGAVPLLLDVLVTPL